MAKRAAPKNRGKPALDERTDAVLSGGVERLRGFGLTVEPVTNAKARGKADAWFGVGRGRDRKQYAVLVKKRLTPALLGTVRHQVAEAAAPVLIVTDYVTPPLAERL